MYATDKCFDFSDSSRQTADYSVDNIDNFCGDVAYVTTYSVVKFWLKMSVNCAKGTRSRLIN